MTKFYYFVALLCCCLLFPFLTYAQPDPDSLGRAGLHAHDRGNYSEAVQLYKKALEFTSDTPLFFYEISFSYLAMKEYDSVILYTDKVLSSPNTNHLQAYIAKGSALQALKNTEASNAVLLKAIKEFGYQHTLCFNLAVNYFQSRRIQDCVELLEKSISVSPGHPGSHMLYGYAMQELDKQPEALLAFHYFLFLEPHSKRSSQIVEAIQSMYLKNVQIKDTNKINIFINPDNPSDFKSVATMMPLLIASMYTPSAIPTTTFEKFNTTSTLFFSCIATDSKKKKKRDKKTSVIWNLYIPSFASVKEAGLFPDLIRYITSGTMDESAEWLRNNPDMPARLSETIKVKPEK